MATGSWQELAPDGVWGRCLLVSAGEQIIMASHSLVITEHGVISFLGRYMLIFLQFGKLGPPLGGSEMVSPAQPYHEIYI